LEKCFPNELTANGWLPKLKEIIPSYGVSLIDDADFLRRIRADTAPVLKVENIESSSAPPLAKAATSGLGETRRARFAQNNT
jgi:malate dehydrogenase (quinone)